nr:hypothetical protein [Neobacillus sp. Marseille-Q6967]
MKLLYLIEDVLNNELNKIFSDLRNQLEETANIIQQLVTNDKQNVRLKEVLVIEKIKAELKKDALHMWSQKPTNQRFIGFLRKKENIKAREQFIKEYANRYNREIELFRFILKGIM